MLVEKNLFRFRYKIQKLPEYCDDKDNWFWINVNILEEDYFKARNKAEKWLETDGHQYYKYTEWVGFEAQGTERVLIDE